MTVLGLGCDIIEIARIKKSIEKHGDVFLSKIFTINEQSYCKCFRNSSPNFAARFAAKEAISKAFAVGIGSKLSWLDMEIRNDDRGKPYVLFQPHIKIHFNDPIVKITLSHSKEYAMAVAIWSNE